MATIWAYLVNNNIVGSFLGGMVSNGILIFIIERLINHRLKEKFESYKQDLQLYNSRLVQDYTLWATKRHDMFAKLHYDIITLISSMQNLDDIIFPVDYANLDEKRLKEMLEQLQCSENEIIDAVNDWKNHQPLRLKISIFHQRYIINQIRLKKNRAKMTFVNSELYLSDELQGYINNIFNNIKQVLEKYECLNKNMSEISEKYDSDKYGGKHRLAPEITEEEDGKCTKLKADICERMKSICNDWKETIQYMRSELSGKYEKK